MPMQCMYDKVKGQKQMPKVVKYAGKAVVLSLQFSQYLANKIVPVSYPNMELKIEGTNNNTWKTKAA